ncbi:MAG TPA: hypothetical protein ENI68_11325 [Gammaproteobacteria bacterium]|nr:hypothetical protein [Gammaproteobacteria bacterium]
MGWFDSIYSWTVLAQGMRHGRSGKPNNQGCRHVDFVKRDIILLEQVLEKIGIETGVDIIAKGRSDDFDQLIFIFKELLRGKDIDIDRLTRSEMTAIVEILAEAVKCSAMGADRKDLYGEKLSFYEAELVNIAEENISKLCVGWEKKKHKLESKAKRVQHHLSDIHEEYDRYHRFHEEKYYRIPARMLPFHFYLPAMIMIGIAEFIFNIQAFSVLDIEKKDIYMIALAPSFAFPFLAHLIGTKMRQGLLLGEQKIRSYIVLGVAVASIFMGLASVLYLRADYLIGKGVDLNIWINLSLLGLNLLFLGSATAAAYASHDPDRELENIYDHKKALRRSINRKWREWSRVASKYDRKRGVVLARIQAIRDDARAKIDEYRLGVSLTSKESTPEAFLGSVTDWLFMPRNIGPEIDLVPPTLEEALDTVSSSGKVKS